MTTKKGKGSGKGPVKGPRTPPRMKKHKAKKHTSGAEKIERLRAKVKEAVAMVKETSADMAELGPLLEQGASWVHRNTWKVENHHAVGVALAAKYKAMVEGGMPVTLAHELMILLLKDKNAQDPLGALMQPTLAMVPMATQMGVKLAGMTHGDEEDERPNFAVLNFPGGPLDPMRPIGGGPPDKDFEPA
jgi:hypothetical protein